MPVTVGWPSAKYFLLSTTACSMPVKLLGNLGYCVGLQACDIALCRHAEVALGGVLNRRLRGRIEISARIAGLGNGMGAPRNSYAEMPMRDTKNDGIQPEWLSWFWSS